MSVKTIFKVLITSIFLMVAIPLAIEIVNILTVGMQVKQMTKVAANQALALYSQETYRISGGASATGTALAARLTDMKDGSGSTYITKNFYGYGSSSEYSIYNSLYANSDTFKSFCSSTSDFYVTTRVGGVGGASSATVPVTFKFRQVNNGVVSDLGSSMGARFQQLGLIYQGLTGSVIYNETRSSSYQAESNAAAATSYVENMYTPVNIGVPYFDPTVTNRMFQWNLAELLSNTSDSNIQEDDNGVTFVNFNGFRCYVQDAYISGYTFYVIANSDSASLGRFTNMYTYDSSGLSNIGNTEDGGEAYYDANNYTIVVGVDYVIPISYEGITPIKRIINFAWTREVNGMDDSRTVVEASEAQLSGASGDDDLWNNEDEDVNTLMSGGYDVATAIGNLTGGTTNGLRTRSDYSDGGSTGILDTSGEFYFVLTR
jgi:hypothetical protein